VTNKKITFDDLKDKQKSMNLSDIYTFMNDFKLTESKNIKRETVKKIIKLINLKTNSTTGGVTEVDQEGFIDLVLQIGHLYYDNMDRASVFMPLLFEYFKDISLASKTPMF